MKIAEAAAEAARPVPAAPQAVAAESATGAAADEARTRDRVRRCVLEHGPVTASDLAERLGLTASAVRRHLDGLQSAGLITEGHTPHTPQGRGRGRPARYFVLTPAGHAADTSGYDTLAVAALGFLGEAGGPAAVRRFAEARVAEWEQRYRPVVDAAGSDLSARVDALAEALSQDGYAASIRPVEGADSATGPGAGTGPGPGTGAGPGMSPLGTQLCQGHCPVQRVAAQFPQLCEAEAEAFGRLLGVHVQRLATLAHGEHVCTTHVPNAPVHLRGAAPEDPQRPTTVHDPTTVQDATKVQDDAMNVQNRERTAR